MYEFTLRAEFDSGEGILFAEKVVLWQKVPHIGETINFHKTKRTKVTDVRHEIASDDGILVIFQVNREMRDALLDDDLGWTSIVRFGP